MEKTSILATIFEKVRENRHKSPSESYSARLFQHAKGKNKILEKLGEEATETIIAAKDGDKQKIIHEVADLWFHTIALLAFYDIELSELLEELANRQNKYK